MSDQELREILIKLREFASAGGNGSLYGDREKALTDIDSVLACPDLQKELRRIGFLIVTTGNLQELSMECGWANSFHELATRLETNF